MNFIEVDCIVSGDQVFVSCDGIKFELPKEKAEKAKAYKDKKVIMGVRPDDVIGNPEYIQNHQDSTLEAEIKNYELLGSEVIVYFQVEGNEMTARLNTLENLNRGDKIKVAINPKKVHLFDKETELTITN